MSQAQRDATLVSSETGRTADVCQEHADEIESATMTTEERVTALKRTLSEVTQR